jgi:hypothetical protein
MSFLGEMKNILQHTYLGGGFGGLGIGGQDKLGGGLASLGIGIIPSILGSIFNKKKPEPEAPPWMNPDLFAQFQQGRSPMGPYQDYNQPEPQPSFAGWYDQFLQKYKRPGPYKF